MEKYRSRGIYRILRYMSRKGRYPGGIPRSELEARYDKGIISELIYYDYLAENSVPAVYITVKGREALRLHVLTVVNVITAIVAVLIAVLALFLQQQVQCVNLPQ